MPSLLGLCWQSGQSGFQVTMVQPVYLLTVNLKKHEQETAASRYFSMAAAPHISTTQTDLTHRLTMDSGLSKDCSVSGKLTHATSCPSNWPLEAGCLPPVCTVFSLLKDLQQAKLLQLEEQMVVSKAPPSVSSREVLCDTLI